jgi:cytochrome c-type biogenesis protein
MSDFFVDQVFDGGILLASLVALVAGLISFASPCVIPLVPGYLAYVGGVAGSRRKVLTGASLFVLGFSLLFISYGALFGELGSRILSNSENPAWSSNNSLRSHLSLPREVLSLLQSFICSKERIT